MLCNDTRLCKPTGLVMYLRLKSVLHVLDGTNLAPEVTVVSPIEPKNQLSILAGIIYTDLFCVSWKTHTSLSHP